MDLQVWSEEIETPSQNIFELPTQLECPRNNETQNDLVNGHCAKIKKIKGRNLSNINSQDGTGISTKPKREKLFDPTPVRCLILTGNSLKNGNPIPNNSYTCDQCGKEFHLASHLKTHSKVHASEKNFCCTVCDRTFVDATSLRRHLKKHSGEKPYRCDECGKTFSIPNNFKKHVRTHTGEKPYVCPVCRKSFSSGSNLKTHMKSHAGERPYSCNVCSKTFTLKGHLVTHHRIHFTEKTYSCHRCERSFRVASSLKRHLLIHEELGLLISIKDGGKDDEADGAVTNKCAIDEGPSSNIAVLPRVESSFDQQRGTDATVCTHSVKTETSIGSDFYDEGLGTDVVRLNSKVQLDAVDLKKNVLNKNRSPRIHLQLPNATKSTSNHLVNKITVDKIFSSHLPECDRYVTLSGQSFRSKWQTESRNMNGISLEQLNEASHSSESGHQRFVCSACGRQFNTSSMLEEHLRSHNTGSQFTCKLCTTTFMEASSLGRHMRKHMS